MRSHESKPELFNVLRQDVSAELVDELLKEQRDIGLFMQVSLAEWEALSNSHPELSYYIAMTAYEVSKGDPLQRERIAASLLGLCKMLDQDIVEKIAGHMEHAVGEDAHGAVMLELPADFTTGAGGVGEDLPPAV